MEKEVNEVRLQALRVLNEQFKNEGRSGCLEDRQVRLVLDAMIEFRRYTPPITAEEFFRNKIKQLNPFQSVVTLSQELITAEQAMRWAHEYASLKTSIDNTYSDGHGYEIAGLKEAKTKEEKIKALENHLTFLESHQSEVFSGIERKINDLKYGKS